MKLNVRRALVGLVAVLGALSVGAVAGQSTAFAANPGCGFRCDGQDPHTYNVCFLVNSATVCNANPDITTLCEASATTRASFNAPAEIGGGPILLRVSSLCRTMWVKWVPQTNVCSGGCDPAPDFDIYIQALTSSGSQRVRYDKYPGYAWSPMVNDANLRARACLTDRDVSPTKTSCTAAS